MMRHSPNKGRWPLRLASTATIFVLALLVWTLPFFHLQEIELSPLSEMKPQEVLATSELEIGQHLFKGLGGSLQQIIQLRYPAVETALGRQFPEIRSVTASMRFPGKIRIIIDERIQIAYLSIPDGCAVIDKDAVVIRILAEPPEGIPVIEGIMATSLILGEPLGVDVPSALNSAISLTGAIIDADKDTRTMALLMPAITNIRPVGGRQVYLTIVLPATGVMLYVKAETGGDMQEDMLWLRFALGQDAFSGLGKGILDLTGSRRTFMPDS